MSFIMKTLEQELLLRFLDEGPATAAEICERHGLIGVFPEVSQALAALSHKRLLLRRWRDGGPQWGWEYSRREGDAP